MKKVVEVPKEPKRVKTVSILFRQILRLQVVDAQPFIVLVEEIRRKNKGKGKASQSFATNEVAAEIRALRLTRDNEIEVMQKLGNARIELEREKLQRNQMKMKEVMLNTLLAKDHLSPEDEEMKHKLMAIVFGQ